ncbi:hypothetical protein IW262DRAFT_1483100 [Armillaria fumosa]|nr:hypothetical protein IW262DRAFT_1483100 [Armillaria fumosa]
MTSTHHRDQVTSTGVPSWWIRASEKFVEIQGRCGRQKIARAADAHSSSEFEAVLNENLFLDTCHRIKVFDWLTPNLRKRLLASYTRPSNHPKPDLMGKKANGVTSLVEETRIELLEGNGRAWPDAKDGEQILDRADVLCAFGHWAVQRMNSYGGFKHLYKEPGVPANTCFRNRTRYLERQAYVNEQRKQHSVFMAASAVCGNNVLDKFRDIITPALERGFPPSSFPHGTMSDLNDVNVDPAIGKATCITYRPDDQPLTGLAPQPHTLQYGRRQMHYE